MAGHPAPGLGQMLRTIAVARLILQDMNIQAPADYRLYLWAGINDWGGISPLTPDFINPEAPGRSWRSLKPPVGPRGLNSGSGWPSTRNISGRSLCRPGFGLRLRPLRMKRAWSGRSWKDLRIAGGLEPGFVGILERALAGEDITVAEAERLFGAKGPEINALVLVADELRRRRVGGLVTYVCIKRYGLCAFSRGHREETAYFLPLEEVVRRAVEAQELGATEVCIQAGLPPKLDGYSYVDLTRTVERAAPKLHIHASSPEKVLYGAVRAGCSVEDYLKALKEAGLGSIPGTAEILDDEVRQRISLSRWVEVITTAHRLGIPSTATIMCGHVETDRHKAAHLGLIREIQRQTGGFTEFIPLSFVHEEAPMWGKRLVAGVRPGATGSEVVKMYAVSRIMLNNWVPNIQVSWVKEGPKFAQFCLNAGGNDFMGTLMNESISTSAGAPFGQRLRPREMRRLIRDIGRAPAERTTTYRILRVFPADQDDHYDPLDLIDDPSAEARFGSYRQLLNQSEFRYREVITRRSRPG